MLKNSGFTLIRTLFHRNLDNVHGFTLIELLVVAFSLGLLACIAVYLIQPFELMKLRHDSDKLIELGSLHSAGLSGDFEATKSATVALEFCADEIGWEIDTTLESKDHMEKMKKDKGNNDKKYEIGTNLNCTY